MPVERHAHGGFRSIQILHQGVYQKEEIHSLLHGIFSPANSQSSCWKDADDDHAFTQD